MKPGGGGLNFEMPVMPHRGLGDETLGAQAIQAVIFSCSTQCVKLCRILARGQLP